MDGMTWGFVVVMLGGLAIFILCLYLGLRNPEFYIGEYERWAIRFGQGRLVKKENEYYYHFEWNQHPEEVMDALNAMRRGWSCIASIQFAIEQKLPLDQVAAPKHLTEVINELCDAHAALVGGEDVSET